MQLQKKHIERRDKNKSRNSMKKMLKMLLFLLTGAGFLRLLGLKALVEEVLPLLDKNRKYETPPPTKPQKSKKTKIWEGCLVILIAVLVLLIIGLILCARAFKN
jgi:small neutral amino acid transporter SnatA (MarC family)